MLPQTVRIAPSPTGLFHLGTARTAYFNYLAAKSSGGTFILRIDDTDTERNKDEYTKVILDSLEWLGLEHDKIYYQSQRLKIYQETARKLVEIGKAFEATNGAVILKNGTSDLPRSFKDHIAGEIKITDTNKDQIRDRVVLLRGNSNSDTKSTLGQPTYQFASCVDDYYMGVNNIIRGVDHITNTPKQIAIWQALNEIHKGAYQIPEDNITINGEKVPNKLFFEYPQFTHLGLIFKDGKKLSKRDGAASLLWYKEQGYKSEAILDWMLRFGWSLRVARNPEDPIYKSLNMNKAALEKLSSGFICKERAIELFNRGSLKNSPCNYSLEKLMHIQKNLNLI